MMEHSVSEPGLTEARSGTQQLMRVLVIEDDKDAAAYLAKGAQRERPHRRAGANGKDGLLLAATESFDSLVVDRMLPGLDGLRASSRPFAPPATARPCSSSQRLGEVDDRVKGLRAGGDDYLVKPYAFSELLARLEALVRRGQPAAPTPRDVLRTAS